MTMQRYDASNSYVTLGNQLLLANQMLQQLMVSDSTMDRIESIEELIGLLEGMLSPYYQFMSLHYYDDKKMKMVKYNDYETAMRHLSQMLKENRRFVDDKMTRHQYIYWLNRKYQLLSSCYGKLKLVPELSGGNDMGAVEDQIPDEVAEMPEQEYAEEERLPEKPIHRPPVYQNRPPQRPVVAKPLPKKPELPPDYDETDFIIDDEPPAE